MADAEDTNGRAPMRKGDITPSVANHSPLPNQSTNQNLGALPMGAMGQGIQSSGPAEWVSFKHTGKKSLFSDTTVGMVDHEFVITHHIINLSHYSFESIAKVPATASLSLFFVCFALSNSFHFRGAT